ncbi:MAG: 3'-5' exonuclease [Alphaproteobacteria bacterium]
MIRAGQDNLLVGSVLAACSAGHGLASPTVTIFDLEFTAWECSMARHWLSPGEFKEVVQIGAVKLDAENFTKVAEFDQLVRPRVNFPLGPYFEKLTGISSQQVDRAGIDFAAAFAAFLDFAGDGPIASFGRDDKVLEENVRLYGLTRVRPLPLFYDLRGWFAVQGVDPRGMHSCDIGPAVGIPFEGRTHNALDDARSIAAAMAKMAKNGARLHRAA